MKVKIKKGEDTKKGEHTKKGEGTKKAEDTTHLGPLLNFRVYSTYFLLRHK